LLSCSTVRDDRADLLGFVSWDYWKANSGWTDFSAADYSPDSADVSAIGKFAATRSGISFVVCGSAGCDHCREHLPRIYKLLNQAKIPAEKIRLLGLDKFAEEPSGIYKKYGVEFVPAVVVLSDGKVIGTAGYPKYNWSKEIKEILEKK
jgi:hypothetical protein